MEAGEGGMDEPVFVRWRKERGRKMENRRNQINGDNQRWKGRIVCGRERVL